MEDHQTGGSTNSDGFLQQSGNQIKDWVKNNNMFIIIILIAIFLGIAFLIFTYFVQPALNSTYVANNEYQQFDPEKKDWSKHIGGGKPATGAAGDSTKQINLVCEIYLFYADWCPYSKTLKAENGPWEKLKEAYEDGKKINNTSYILKYIEINGDTDANAIESFESRELSNAKGIKKKIDGYPSIYLKKDDQIIEYEAEPSFNGLDQFIKSVIINNYSGEDT
jgi:hypothetical protein